MLPPVEKPFAVRDLGAVDPGAMRDKVLAISERMWDMENARKENAFGVFHHTRHIVFRFTPANRDPEDFYETPTWHIWRSLLEPIMRQAILPYGFAKPEFPKAMLARLAAGHAIDRHTDGAGSNLLTHKIHVPLITNPAAYFVSRDELIHLTYGSAWEVNNIAPHGGVNGGGSDRIHFIFEVFDRANTASAAA